MSEQEVRRALKRYREAMRLTREYLGPDVLPEIGGWSWYDADQEATRVLAK